MTEEQCSICLEETLNCDTRNLTCGHTFHTKCFDEWSSKSICEGVVTCPYCRHELVDPFECYRSIAIIPGAVEVVYVPFEQVSVKNNYTKCVSIFVLITIIQTAVIYIQFKSCL